MKRSLLKRKTPMKRSRMSRRPKQTIGKAKAEAWKWFSRFVRLRDSKPLNPEDGTPYCRCITCGHSYPMKTMQAGHFIPGRHNVLIYDERNCHAQCRTCNVFKHGNWVAYERFMIERYGVEVVAELKAFDRIIQSMTAADHMAYATKYMTTVSLMGGWPETE